MITNKKKNEKTTEIYFDETPAPVIIRTHNTALKKRLLAFVEKFPDLCRLTAPYTEERRQLARAKMIEINNKEDVE